MGGGGGGGGGGGSGVKAILYTDRSCWDSLKRDKKKQKTSCCRINMAGLHIYGHFVGEKYQNKYGCARFSYYDSKLC